MRPIRRLAARSWSRAAAVQAGARTAQWPTSRTTTTAPGFTRGTRPTARWRTTPSSSPCCRAGPRGGVEVEGVRVGERLLETRGAGDHRGIGVADRHRRAPELGVELLHTGAPLAVGRHAAADREPCQTLALDGLACSRLEHVHDCPLIGRGEVGLAPLGLLLAEVAHAVEERGL